MFLPMTGSDMLLTYVNTPREHSLTFLLSSLNLFISILHTSWEYLLTFLTAETVDCLDSRHHSLQMHIVITHNVQTPRTL